MAGLPVTLKLEGRRCLIIGGGSVAVRRATALVEAGAVVCVVAPQVAEKLVAMGVEVRQRAYAANDLAGAMVVVVATNDPALNDQITADARAAGALVNRADDPAAGDVSVPAHHRHGPVTVAVDTSGISASAAAAIRRELSEALDPDWVRLLEAAGPYRAKIQERFGQDSARRLEKLTALAGPDAMATLKREGLAGLTAFCERLLNEP